VRVIIIAASVQKINTIDYTNLPYFLKKIPLILYHNYELKEINLISGNR